MSHTIDGDAGRVPDAPVPHVDIDSGPPGTMCEVPRIEVPIETFPTCEEHWHETVRELGRLQRCDRNEDCGQSLRTGCGCTRSLVGRCDTNAGRFEMLRGNPILEECADRPWFASSCDCPSVDGTECIAGRCEWRFRDEPVARCVDPARALGVWPEPAACLCGLANHPFFVEFDARGLAIDARDAAPGPDSPWTAETRACVLRDEALATRCYPLLGGDSPLFDTGSCTL